MFRWLRRQFGLLTREEFLEDHRKMVEAIPEQEPGDPREDEWEFFAAAGYRLQTTDLDAYREGCKQYSRAVVEMAAVLCYRSATQNSGHFGFFEAAGPTWPDAIAGLERLDCTEAIAILREAIRRAGVTETSSRKDYLALFDADLDFDDLDSRLWALDDAIGEAMRREFTERPLTP